MDDDQRPPKRDREGENPPPPFLPISRELRSPRNVNFVTPYFTPLSNNQLTLPATSNLSPTSASPNNHQEGRFDFHALNETIGRNTGLIRRLGNLNFTEEDIYLPVNQRYYSSRRGYRTLHDSPLEPPAPPSTPTHHSFATYINNNNTLTNGTDSPTVPAAPPSSPIGHNLANINHNNSSNVPPPLLLSSSIMDAANSLSSSSTNGGNSNINGVHMNGNGSEHADTDYSGSGGVPITETRSPHSSAASNLFASTTSGLTGYSPQGRQNSPAANSSTSTLLSSGTSARTARNSPARESQRSATGSSIHNYSFSSGGMRGTFNIDVYDIPSDPQTTLNMLYPQGGDQQQRSHVLEHALQLQANLPRGYVKEQPALPWYAEGSKKKHPHYENLNSEFDEYGNRSDPLYWQRRHKDIHETSSRDHDKNITSSRNRDNNASPTLNNNTSSRNNETVNASAARNTATTHHRRVTVTSPPEPTRFERQYPNFVFPDGTTAASSLPPKPNFNLSSDVTIKFGGKVPYELGKGEKGTDIGDFGKAFAIDLFAGHKGKGKATYLKEDEDVEEEDEEEEEGDDTARSDDGRDAG